MARETHVALNGPPEYKLGHDESVQPHYCNEPRCCKVFSRREAARDHLKLPVTSDLHTGHGIAGQTSKQLNKKLKPCFNLLRQLIDRNGHVIGKTQHGVWWMNA